MDRALLVASVVFVVVCVIKAAMVHHAISDGDVAALSASHPTGAASTTAEANEGESSAAPRSGWPKVDRDRLRFGVLHDVADAFELGEHSGFVSLSTDSEQRLFETWRERSAAWPSPWNRDPVLYADGKDPNGALAYRVELHGQELGRIRVLRDSNGWNIVGVERRVTKADLLERRLLREAAARTGVEETEQDSRRRRPRKPAL